ncbi:type II toxin-antitoxin system HicB family antitoxin [Rhizobium halophilum]|uniref:type II toxin-antitoxin system HicB family antitoxin n=1 Tax=Rhizobium halophilum TaxID=2846852 RepID=UPI001EFD4A64|nr:type II toxin-antitoxin system HicB family antitoxin [Rhizobium halophilum]MCF6367515.1 type II toxin-antitoxin system HicB family antitoxin [Rhizobium halophilum]
MTSYIGLIHKEEGSDYGVSFPDFPGVVTAGVTLDEARHLAEEALSFHVEGMLEDGDALPEPAPLELVMRDPANRDGVATLVSVKTPEARAVRINVTLPEDVLKRVDAFASRQGMTRSGFLARAARHEMEREGGPL